MNKSGFENPKRRLREAESRVYKRTEKKYYATREVGQRSGRAGAAATAKAGELEPADEAFAHHGGSTTHCPEGGGTVTRVPASLSSKEGPIEQHFVSQGSAEPL